MIVNFRPITLFITRPTRKVPCCSLSAARTFCRRKRFNFYEIIFCDIKNNKLRVCFEKDSRIFKRYYIFVNEKSIKNGHTKINLIIVPLQAKLQISDSEWSDEFPLDTVGNTGRVTCKGPDGHEMDVSSLISLIYTRPICISYF